MKAAVQVSKVPDRSAFQAVATFDDGTTARAECPRGPESLQQDTISGKDAGTLAFELAKAIRDGSEEGFKRWRVAVVEYGRAINEFRRKDSPPATVESADAEIERREKENAT